jgi:hypothetical protein
MELSSLIGLGSFPILCQKSFGFLCRKGEAKIVPNEFDRKRREQTFSSLGGVGQKGSIIQKRCRKWVKMTQIYGFYAEMGLE